MTSGRERVAELVAEDGNGAGFGLAAVGLVRVAWMAIDEPIWTRSAEYGYYKASLLQIKMCERTQAPTTPLHAFIVAARPPSSSSTSVNAARNANSTSHQRRLRSMEDLSLVFERA